MYDHAIVIGAGITGLSTSRVLTDHFRAITLIEKDPLPHTPTSRKGVPQDRHLHLLLDGGRRALEDLFPGIATDMARARVPAFGMNDARIDTPHGPFPTLGKDVTMWGGRIKIEHVLRERVRQLGTVSLRTARVTGLCSTPDGKTITGVRLQDGTSLQADLVVDASGAGSSAPAWLESIGASRPKESLVQIGLTYASQVYQAQLPDNLHLYYRFTDFQENTRLAGALALGDEEIIVTLAVTGNGAVPRTEADFSAFAENFPLLRTALHTASPRSDIATMQILPNRIRHYEKLSSLPEKFLLAGHAVTVFNPAYGQGMSMALQNTVLLGKCLDAHPSLKGISRYFQRRLARANHAAWRVSGAGDYQYPHVTGTPPRFPTQLENWYGQKIQPLFTQDPDAAERFTRVFHLLSSPTSLAHPKFLAYALRYSLRHTPLPTYSHAEDLS